MMQSASSVSPALAVNEEVILEQVLSKRSGHKTGVGPMLSQRYIPALLRVAPAQRELWHMWTHMSKNICTDCTSRTSRCMRATGWCSNCWPSYTRTYSFRQLLVWNRMFLQVIRLIRVPRLRLMVVMTMPVTRRT